MNEPENFLTRWSRRKRQAAEEPAKPAEVADKQEEVIDRKEKPVADPTVAPPQPAGASPEEFDLASLPSIESIDATTDISVFLQPGVPAELTRAALRRAWLADPAIRDFIGIAENQWDFTKPGGVPGFDFAAPSDLKRMIADIFREGLDKPADQLPATSDAQSGKSAPAAAPKTGTAALEDGGEAPLAPPTVSNDPSAQPVIAEHKEDNAAQHDKEGNPATRNGRRGHGGALPT